MNPIFRYTSLVFIVAALAILGCESDGSSGDSGGEAAICADGDAMCSEDGMISYCVDGEYGEAEACPEEQYCMTMPDTGVTHCMLMEEDGMETMDDGMETMDDGMETMDDGMETMDDGMETMDDGMETMDDGMETMDEDGETGDEG